MLDLLINSWFDVMENFLPLLGKCLHMDFYKGFDFETYFINTNLYNETNEIREYPKLIDHTLTDKKDTYIFTVPNGYGKQKLLQYKEGLELAIGYPIEYDFNKSNWIISVQKSKLPTKVNYIHHYKKNSLKIPLGESIDSIIEIDLKENPNTYICGTTGSGKSVCSKSILTTIINNFNANRMKIILCDLKKVELNLFKNVEHVERFAHDLTEITEIIEDTFIECEERYNIFMKNNVVNIYEYNKNRKDKIPYKVLFIEEIVLLLQDKKHVAMETLKQILPICRACGIFVIMTMQRPSCDVIDNIVKSCVNNRIVFKCEDSKNSLIALDDEGGENLKGNGHGILKVSGVKTEFQGYFISTKQTKELIKPYEVKKEIKKEIDLSFIDKI